jgi:hypothetical protein
MHNRNNNTFPVEIELKGKAKTRAMARNISTEGMLLELDSAPQNTQSSIQLACRLNNKDWLIDATVVHATSRGLGVKFRQPQPGLVRAAMALLPRQTNTIAGHFSLA